MKRIICVVLVIVLVAMLCGCRREVGEEFTWSGRFVIVSGSNPNAPYHETVITDKETGVMYLVIYVCNHCGITPLLDSDGKPLLWKEAE